ncbi:MAG: glycosyltransferase family 2 protein, partial [Candidatus Buchananbacteria bacterium]|nr:glycosyltransferase family 2 protein [Candidatus Buchananbacteria bacterium]
MTQLTENQLETPVAFFIYRRASLTAKSFAAISEVRPKRL